MVIGKNKWVTIALGDVAWISLALSFGVRLTVYPLADFMTTGFILNYLGISSREVPRKLAEE